MTVLRNLLRNRADADTLSYAVFDAWQHNNKKIRANCHSKQKVHGNNMYILSAVFLWKYLLFSFDFGAWWMPYNLPVLKQC